MLEKMEQTWGRVWKKMKYLSNKWSASLYFSEVICNLKLNRGGERERIKRSMWGRKICVWVNKLYTLNKHRLANQRSTYKNNQKTHIAIPFLWAPSNMVVLRIFPHAACPSILTKWSRALHLLLSYRHWMSFISISVLKATLQIMNKLSHKIKSSSMCLHTTINSRRSKTNSISKKLLPQQIGDRKSIWNLL